MWPLCCVRRAVSRVCLRLRLRLCLPARVLIPTRPLLFFPRPRSVLEALRRVSALPVLLREYEPLLRAAVAAHMQARAQGQEEAKEQAEAQTQTRPPAVAHSGADGGADASGEGGCGDKAAQTPAPATATAPWEGEAAGSPQRSPQSSPQKGLHPSPQKGGEEGGEAALGVRLWAAVELLATYALTPAGTGADSQWRMACCGAWPAVAHGSQWRMS